MMNATSPARQPPCEITSWPSGAQKNVPMEPAAETMPNARLRRCGRDHARGDVGGDARRRARQRDADQHAGAQREHGRRWSRVAVITRPAT